MKKVACVGILVADVLVSPVSAYPEKGKLAPVSQIALKSGGNAMTASLNLQRLKTPTTLIGKVGKDAFGDFLLERLRAGGVDTRGTLVDERVQTSASVLMIDEATKERSFFHCVGANATFSLADIDFSVIEDSDLVFVTGTFLLSHFDGEETVSFLKKCKEMGKTTLLDVCWDASGRWGELLYGAMPYIDIFMPSIDEAREIAKADEVAQMAEDFLAHGVHSVIIKCGKEGCYIRESMQSKGEMLPPVEAGPVVDTTGAGDSFCSGVLAALARGEDFRSAARIGNAVAAYSITKMGAGEGITTYEDAVALAQKTN